jgi:hypothetical protein
MGIDIGVGTLIKIGTAAAPMNAANGGTALDADLTDMSDVLKNFSFTNTQGTVDITTLGSASPDYVKDYISGLSDAKVTFDYIDQPTLITYKRFDDTRKGNVHALGRGKVDVIVLVGGATTGNAKLSFTMIFDAIPLSIEIEKEYGGQASGQVCGAITVTAQS